MQVADVSNTSKNDRATTSVDHPVSKVMLFKTPNPLISDEYLINLDWVPNSCFGWFCDGLGRLVRC